MCNVYIFTLFFIASIHDSYNKQTDLKKDNQRHPLPKIMCTCVCDIQQMPCTERFEQLLLDLERNITPVTLDTV